MATNLLTVYCKLQLPIDVELFERREQLKKSGLGKVKNIYFIIVKLLKEDDADVMGL